MLVIVIGCCSLLHYIRHIRPTTTIVVRYTTFVLFPLVRTHTHHHHHHHHQLVRYTIARGGHYNWQLVRYTIARGGHYNWGHYNWGHPPWFTALKGLSQAAWSSARGIPNPGLDRRGTDVGHSGDSGDSRGQKSESYNTREGGKEEESH